MIFSPDMIDAIRAGRKTQTRRLADEVTHRLIEERGRKRVETRSWLYYKVIYGGTGDSFGIEGVDDLYSEWRLRWCIGCTYAVQPGRGKKAVGRIRITGIDLQRVCDISEQDARAEGFDSREAFFAKWRALHGEDCDLNDSVWVLAFQAVQP